MSLLIRIDRHLRQTGIAPTRFGREVVGDPRLVHDLRQGRVPRERLRARIEAALAERA